MDKTDAEREDTRPGDSSREPHRPHPGRLEFQSEEAVRLQQWVEAQLQPLKKQIEELQLVSQRSSDKHNVAVNQQDDVEEVANGEPAGKPVPVPSAGSQDPVNAGDRSISSEATCRMLEVTGFSEMSGYALQRSVWDAALLIGLPVISVRESVFAAFLLLLNIMIQGVFLFGSGILATDAAVDSKAEEGYKLWRLTVAHSWEYFDPIQNMSMVQQACNNEHAFSLSLSTNQANAVQTLRQYLEPHELTGPFPIGPMMCACALVLWYALLAPEVSSAIQFTTAVWSSPLGQTRLRHSDKGEGVRVASIGLARKVAVTLMALLRLFVAGTLIYTGSWFLITSEKVGDLLLNVAALGVIVDVDEMIFESCMTASFARAIEILEPLHLPRRKIPPGLLRILLVVSLSFTLIPVWLVRDTEWRQRALAALCDGRTDFVYKVYESGLMRWTETLKEESDLESDLACDRFPMVWRETPLSADQIGFTASSLLRDIMCGDRGQHGLNEFRLHSVDHGLSSLSNFIEVPDCVDVLHCLNHGYQWDAASRLISCGGQPVGTNISAWRMAKSVLEERLGGVPLQSCDQFLDKCFELSVIGMMWRYWCPITCGCHNPASANALAVPKNGCPSCFSKQQEWLGNNLPFAECRDSTLEELHGSGWRGNWKLMWNKVKDITVPSLAIMRERDFWDILASNFRDYGCDVYPFYQAIIDKYWDHRIDGKKIAELCTGEGYWGIFKGIQVWCPRTCNACSNSTGSATNSALQTP